MVKTFETVHFWWIKLNNSHVVQRKRKQRKKRKNWILNGQSAILPCKIHDTSNHWIDSLSASVYFLCSLDKWIILIPQGGPSRPAATGCFINCVDGYSAGGRRVERGTKFPHRIVNLEVGIIWVTSSKGILVLMYLIVQSVMRRDERDLQKRQSDYMRYACLYRYVCLL